MHAQNEKDLTRHYQAADLGAWVEFDGISPKSLGRHVELVNALRERGHLGRLLVSHDAGWYHVGEANGGTFRPFDVLFTEFVPALKKLGWSETELHQLLEKNPQTAFALRA